MIVSITSSRVTAEHGTQVDRFLEGFLPRLRREPGVVAVYHYNRLEKQDTTTIIIWDDERSLKNYREGALIKEAMAFEQKTGMQSTREAYPLAIAL